jgi:hypothetical protein
MAFEEGDDPVKAIPVSTRVMAPLRDVLHRGIVVEPREGSHGAGMVCVQFTPPVIIEPASSIIYITCPTRDVTVGWF